MKDILIQELKTDDGLVNVTIFTYTGHGDPTMLLNEAIKLYIGNETYNEFIDINMDNPWKRIIIKQKITKFQIKIHNLPINTDKKAENYIKSFEKNTEWLRNLPQQYKNIIESMLVIYADIIQRETVQEIKNNPSLL